MERAPLRPVPRRPEGPVDPSEAIAHVSGSLPALDQPASAALGLVEIAGHTRSEVAATGALAGEQVAEALGRGRKELRRSHYPLPGSGWCERAERMISDRMDGELEPPGPARLDAHLRNCPRCVEHELRLAQAIDALVAGFLEAHPVSAAEAAPARLRPAEAVVSAARPDLRVLPFGEPVAPAPRRPERAVEAPPVEPPPVEPPPVEEPPLEEPPVEEPPVELPTPEPPAEIPAAAAPAQPAGRAMPLLWRAMYLVAVLLAILTVVVTALGIAGVDPL